MATTRVFPSSHTAFCFFPPIVANFKSKNPSSFRFNFHCHHHGRPSSFPQSMASFVRCSSHRPESYESVSSKQEIFVLTTPLYYVNAPPHMGSAYTTIAADAIARFQRLNGKKVIFITGTDEHGEKIATAASAHGRSPKEHCDIISQAYRMLWKDLDITFDKFIRTTDSSHEAVVKEFYSRVLDSGDIYRARYEGLYCINCEEYKDEKDLDEHGCCPIHLKPCVPRKEENFFFALSKYQKLLEEYLDQNHQFVQPAYRLNEVRSWVEDGLRDFSISRASVEWGIPVPNDRDQTIYVWFDALLGYVSALLEAGVEPNLENAVSSGWPASLHLIGKDILRFHAVYWPAMLMSAGLSLPKIVFGHGFLTKVQELVFLLLLTLEFLEPSRALHSLQFWMDVTVSAALGFGAYLDGKKMGKSLGNTLEPKDLVSKFGSDAVRYFFLREVEFGNDGDYSEERFVNIINANLANTIGNLLNRTLGLLKKNCQSTLVVDSAVAASENPFRNTVEELVDKARLFFESLSLSAACASVLEIGNAGNLYIDEHAPWSKFKTGGASSEAAARDLVVILEAVRIIAVALSPITPSLCLCIYSQLGYSKDEFDAVTWNDTAWGGLRGGQVIGEPIPIFARIENRKEGDDKGESPKKATKVRKRIPETQGAARAET